MKSVLCLVLLSVVACGGKKKQADTTPAGGDDNNTPVDKPTGDGAPMVSPETMDEIQRLFQRKGNAVSHCLAIVVDNKELPKNSHGKITLEVTISRAGKADNVKIIKKSLDSKALDQCVIDRVKEIQFPELPNTYPTTYTYAFEAM